MKKKNRRKDAKAIQLSLAFNSLCIAQDKLYQASEALRKSGNQMRWTQMAQMADHLIIPRIEIVSELTKHLGLTKPKRKERKGDRPRK